MDRGAGQGEISYQNVKGTKVFPAPWLGIGQVQWLLFACLLGHSSKVPSSQPAGQGKVNLKKKKEVFRFLCLPNCPTVQMVPPCQILPLAKRKTHNPEPKSQLAAHGFAGRWVQAMCWRCCLFQYGCCSLGTE